MVYETRGHDSGNLIYVLKIDGMTSFLIHHLPINPPSDTRFGIVLLLAF